MSITLMNQQKFVFDENCQFPKSVKLPSNTINHRDLLTLEGRRDELGVTDWDLLKMCSKHNLTMITTDKGMVLKAMKLDQKIVWVKDSHVTKPELLLISGQKIKL